MTPAARLQASIESLDYLYKNDYPADIYLKKWARQNRYAGKRDRDAIYDLVYLVLRHRRRLAWAVSDAPDSRLLPFAALAIFHRFPISEVAAFAGQTAYAPPPLTKAEKTKLLACNMTEPDEPVLSANIPDFLLSEAPLDIYKSLLSRAHLDIRVNLHRTSRHSIQQQFTAQGIEVTPLSAPAALRINQPLNIQNMAEYQNGLIEIQDIGAQMVSQLCAAKAGMQILDYCAGAGGKALALADIIQHEGKIYAYDKYPDRMQDLSARHARSCPPQQKSDCIEIIDASRLSTLMGKMDICLADVPCSGTGRWRRNPETKWHLTPEKLAAFTSMQDEILHEAAQFVKPDGKLIYVTCSVLHCENNARVQAFSKAHPDFELADKRQITPQDDGADGLFITIFRRRAS